MFSMEGQHMKGFCVALLSTLMLFGVIGQAAAQAWDPDAVEIFYELTYDKNSKHGQYDYTVKNNSLGEYTYYLDPSHPEWGKYTESGVTYFDIYFPIGQDDNFYDFSVTPADKKKWDVQLYGKSNNLPAWAFDAYATPAHGEPGHNTLTFPILVDESVTGFSVSFKYKGDDPIGDQQFTVNRLADYKPIFTSTTTQLYHVPEPSGLLLLAAGMFVVVLRRRNGS
jgi:hypothetical protein